VQDGRSARGFERQCHAVLVARSGKLVFERYFKGSDEINGLRVGSVTLTPIRCITSSRLRRASRRSHSDRDRSRLIRSVKRTDLQLLPELSDLRSPEKERISWFTRSQ